MTKDELRSFLKDLKDRKVIANHANLENFLSLKEKERCIYLGIDCTSNDLHIGHLLQIIQVIRFSLAGFRTILVLGDATSRIGDPSDKLKERPQLPKEKINFYCQEIKNKITRIFSEREEKEIEFPPLKTFYSDNHELLNNIYQVLELEKKDPWKRYWQYILPSIGENNSFFQILNNSKWLDKVSFVDFIDKVGRNITINYLLAKGTIKQRVSSEVGLSFLAFSYSLLQAYDFHHLYENYNCNGQLGGSDQWGNITTGLKLIHNYHPQNKSFAFTFNLLVDKEGKKISKTEKQKTIWLDIKKTTFKELFDFFNNMDDKLVVTYMRLFTFISEEKIQKLLILNNPPKLRILQRILLELMFYLLHQREGVDYLGNKGI